MPSNREIGPAPYPLGMEDDDNPGLQLCPTIDNRYLKGYDTGKLYVSRDHARELAAWLLLWADTEPTDAR